MALIDTTVGGIIGYLVAERISEKPDGIRVSVVPQKPSESSGRIYESEVVMVDDHPHRLHENTIKLSDVVVYVSVNDMVFGNVNNQRFPVPVGGSLSVRAIDLSSLWYRNAVNGANGQFNIIGTRQD